MSNIIKNRDDICTSELRSATVDILEAGVRAALPENLVRSGVKWHPEHGVLSVTGIDYVIPDARIFVLGGGKASGAMAQTLESMIGPSRITAGIINCRAGDWKTEKIELVEAGSPIPDERGVDGVKRMLDLKREHAMSYDDVVICLISGGGSALMPCPAEGISIDDMRAVTELLLDSGATINEINAVRKHISRTKGGQLGQHFAPAIVISLIISDVVGDALDVIASGPTVPDASTYEDAWQVLERYDLVQEIPDSIRTRVQKGKDGKADETPTRLPNSRNYIIGSNRIALEAMSSKAQELGFNPTIATSEQTGEPAPAATSRAQEVKNGKFDDHDIVLAGGETTPSVPENHGKGGRNQHYAAASLQAMADYDGQWVVASMDTDGADFDADAAGGIVDNESVQRARAKSLDIQSYLDRCDSATLLQEIDNCRIVTGETGTNVCDVMVHVLR